MRSAPWDLFWIHSGVWLSLMAAFLFITNQADWLFQIFAAIYIATWMTHRLVSFVGPIVQVELRPLMTQRWLHFYLIPLTIIGISFGFLVGGEDLMPGYTRRLGLLLFVRVIADIFHLGLQHYGILRILGLRGERMLGAKAVLPVKIFCILSMVGTYIPNGHLGETLMENFFGTIEAFDFHSVAEGFSLMVSCLVLGMFGLLYMNRRKYFSKNAMIYLGTLLALYFMSLSPLGLIAFLVIRAQHYVCATGLGFGLMGDFQESKYRFSTKTFLSIAGITILGIAMGWTFQSIGFGSEKFVGTFIDKISLTWSVGPQQILMGLAFGFSFAHYYWDRVVYQFRDPQIGPLLRRNLLQKAIGEGVEVF